MSINRENYEVFFVDYLDGNLNEQQISELQAFLALNPDLKDELNDIDTVKLQPAEIQFQHKDSLKKSVPPVTAKQATFEELCVAKLEGELSASESAHFEEITKNDEAKRKEFLLFTKTRLVADTSIVFPNKQKLKRKAAVLFLGANQHWTAAVMSIAATLLLFAWGYFMYFETQTIDQSQFAVTDSVSVPRFQKLMKNAKKITDEAKKKVAVTDCVSVPRFPKLMKNTKKIAKDLKKQMAVSDSTNIPNFQNKNKKENKTNVAEKNQQLAINDSTSIPQYNRQNSKDKKNQGTTKKKDSSNVDKIAFNPDKINHLQQTNNQQIADANTKTNIDSVAKTNNVAQNNQNNSFLAQNTPNETDNQTFANNQPTKNKTQKSETDEYLSFQQLFYSKLQDVVLADKKERRRKINFVDVASATVRGLAKLTGVKMRLTSKVDENGNVEAVAFQSKTFSISRGIK